jgi:hypothetical protein
MRHRLQATEDHPTFAFYETISLGDSSYKLVPRKPVARASVSAAAKLFQKSRRTIHVWIEAGFIVDVDRSCPFRWSVNLSEIEDYIERTKDPEWWTPKRRAAYLFASRKIHSVEATQKRKKTHV